MLQDSDNNKEFTEQEKDQLMTRIMDPRNEHPYTLLTGDDFDPDLFIECNDIVQKTIKGHETELATRFVLTTPNEKLGKLCANVFCILPKSVLFHTLSEMVTLHKSMDPLFGDNPAAFFQSRDFNPDLCHEHAQFVSQQLKGHEQAIGEKLAKENQATRAAIHRQLELLNPNALRDDNVFQRIATFMIPKVEEMQAVPATPPNSPEEATPSNLRHRFLPGLQAQQKKEPENNLSLDYDDDNKSVGDDDEDCLTKIFGRL